MFCFLQEAQETALPEDDEDLWIETFPPPSFIPLNRYLPQPPSFILKHFLRKYFMIPPET